MMFSLRMALVCIHPLLAAFTLALPPSAAHGNLTEPEYKQSIQTHMGSVRCMRFNQYGELLGEPLYYEPPVEWEKEALARDVLKLNKDLRDGNHTCWLHPRQCETLGCEGGKAGIMWCNLYEQPISLPCRFLAEYVAHIVEVCSHRAHINSYVNGMIVSTGWPGDFSVFIGKPQRWVGCQW